MIASGCRWFPMDLLIYGQSRATFISGIGGSQPVEASGDQRRLKDINGGYCGTSAAFGPHPHVHSAYITATPRAPRTAPARAGSSRGSKHKFRHTDQPVKTQSVQIRQTTTFRSLLGIAVPMLAGLRRPTQSYAQLDKLSVEYFYHDALSLLCTNVRKISETFRKTVTQVATKNLKEYRPSLPFWPDQVLGNFVMHLITMGRRRAVSAEEYRAWAAISALRP
ncbi:hypothetical protein C8J57DRAFT_1244193 [Mycena rebaudengoi]|nr:hypothetical protein C8J57DRAFT_1244193 [Mycena rebaudengoi]